MMTKHGLWFAGAALLALTPLSPADAQAPGKDLALDFRVSTTTEGFPEAGVMTGHIVGSGNKVRIDMSTEGGRSPTPMRTGDGPVSMIVSDSGRAIT
ncbi:MAG TPA: hypothetical protein VFS56_12140, partial [Gemmatimonadaceae bacterium]|nr:hypothetical protein [Gemmatimonadaceae bacterium]